MGQKQLAFPPEHARMMTALSACHSFLPHPTPLAALPSYTKVAFDSQAFGYELNDSLECDAILTTHKHMHYPE